MYFEGTNFKLVLAGGSNYDETYLVVVGERNDAGADTQDHARVNLAVCPCTGCSGFIHWF